MAQSKSISKKELETLQGFVNEANKFQMQIGGVEAHKAQLIKALDSVSIKLSAVQKELEEKYGNVNIDLQTGEITSNEEAGAADKKD